MEILNSYIWPIDWDIGTNQKAISSRMVSSMFWFDLRDKISLTFLFTNSKLTKIANDCDRYLNLYDTISIVFFSN